MVKSSNAKDINITDGQISVYEHYLEVVYFGAYHPTNLITLGQTIIDCAASHNVKGSLVNLQRAKGSMTAMDRYELVLAMTDHWPKELLLAVVVKPSQTLKMIGFFWERLARSKGFNTALKFEQESARQWLLQRVKH